MLVTQTLTEEDTFPCIVMFVGSESHLLTIITVQSISVLWWTQLKTIAKWLVAVALYAVSVQW